MLTRHRGQQPRRNKQEGKSSQQKLSSSLASLSLSRYTKRSALLRCLLRSRMQPPPPTHASMLTPIAPDLRPPTAPQAAARRALTSRAELVKKAALASPSPASASRSRSGNGRSLSARPHTVGTRSRLTAMQLTPRRYAAMPTVRLEAYEGSAELMHWEQWLASEEHAIDLAQKRAASSQATTRQTAAQIERILAPIAPS